MTSGEKIRKLREEHEHSVEAFAGIFNVSEQTVNDWESGALTPDKDTLLAIADLYECPLDKVSTDTVGSKIRNFIRDHSEVTVYRGPSFPERTSKTKLFGLPLFQSGEEARAIIALGRKARGFIAIGTYARGFLALGAFAMGILSFGAFSLGVFSFGALSAGILALGAISGGIISMGAIALGIIALGCITAGFFTAGAVTAGVISLGGPVIYGHLFAQSGSLTGSDVAYIKDLVDNFLPFPLSFFGRLFSSFL